MARTTERKVPWTALEAFKAHKGYRYNTDLIRDTTYTKNAPQTWQQGGVPLGAAQEIAKAHGMSLSQFLALLDRLTRGEDIKSAVSSVLVPVVSLDEIQKIRFDRIHHMQELSAPPLIPALIRVPKGTLAAFELPDSSVDRKHPAGSYAIFDWNDKTLEDGRYYLIVIEGQPAVRRYRVGPNRWEPNSHHDFATIFNGASKVEVVGRVTSWHDLED